MYNGSIYIISNHSFTYALQDTVVGILQPTCTEPTTLAITAPTAPTPPVDPRSNR